jgi:hypothetical protein
MVAIRPETRDSTDNTTTLSPDSTTWLTSVELLSNAVEDRPSAALIADSNRYNRGRV